VTRGATVLRDERFAYSDLMPAERVLDARLDA
jgi:hypothetical protein